jgi:hypothetical protein
MHVESNILEVKDGLNNLSSNYVLKKRTQKDNVQMNVFFEEKKIINEQPYKFKIQKRSSILDSLI